MKVTMTTATWAPPHYNCVLVQETVDLPLAPEEWEKQQDVTVVDEAETFAIIQASTKEKPMPTVEHILSVVEYHNHNTGETHRYPVATRGRDLTGPEYTALSIKLDYGTFEAARFLRMCGWGMIEARELLCVRGRNVV
jgi:hypothetical protein